MEIILGGRSSGKTTEAVAWVKEHEDAVLVVLNEQMGRHVQQRYGLDQRQIVTLQQIKNGRLRGRTPHLVLDGLEFILASALGTQPEVVTMQVEDLVPGGSLLHLKTHPEVQQRIEEDSA